VLQRCCMLPALHSWQLLLLFLVLVCRVLLVLLALVLLAGSAGPTPGHCGILADVLCICISPDRLGRRDTKQGSIALQKASACWAAACTSARLRAACAWRKSVTKTKTAAAEGSAAAAAAAGASPVVLGFLLGGGESQSGRACSGRLCSRQ
jgi:hypothetical protein